MKKFLIVVLLLALCAGAFLSKPKDPKANFTNYLADKISQKDTVLPASFDTAAASAYANGCTYSDRILWIDVKQPNGQTVFTSVFSKWVNRAEVKEAAQADLEKAKDKMDHAIDKVAGKS